MPPRSKSCLNCRIARAKCSLSDPCFRCTKRNLECQYPSLLSNGGGIRRPRIIKPALNSRTGNGQARSAGFEASHLEAHSSMLVMASNTPAPDWLDAADASASQLFGPWQTDQTSSSASLSHCSAGTGLMEPSMEGPLSPLWFEGLDLTAASRISEEISLEAFTQLAMPHQSSSSEIEALELQLSQRTRSIQQGSLTAKMVFSRLSDYTRMLADGKELPPFIYPPCYASQSNQCLPGLPHQCLPETLAVCTNLTRIFHNCKPESRGYAWHQVRLHIQHLYAYVSRQHRHCAVVNVSLTSCSSKEMMCSIWQRQCKQLWYMVCCVLNSKNIFRGMMPPGWSPLLKCVFLLLYSGI